MIFDFCLILLSWMFISCYTTIYFFAKKNYCFEYLYFSEYNIRIFLCVFFGWERGHQLSPYATGEGMGNHQNCVQLHTWGGGYYVLCIPKHSHLFSCIWQHLFLIVSCFVCKNLTLPLFKQDVLVTNGFFSAMKSISSS